MSTPNWETLLSVVEFAPHASPKDLLSILGPQAYESYLRKEAVRYQLPLDDMDQKVADVVEILVLANQTGQVVTQGYLASVPLGDNLFVQAARRDELAAFLEFSAYLHPRAQHRAAAQPVAAVAGKRQAPAGKRARIPVSAAVAGFLMAGALVAFTSKPLASRAQAESAYPASTESDPEASELEDPPLQDTLPFLNPDALLPGLGAESNATPGG